MLIVLFAEFFISTTLIFFHGEATDVQNVSFSPDCSGWWTKFYDRDDPTSGFEVDYYWIYGSVFYDGEYETLSWLRKENPGEICFNPTAIDARVIGNHTHYSQTGQTLTVAPRIGLTCENTQQPNGTCLDYEVRFCCPTTCGDDFIADEEIRSFSIKDYLDGYPPDVDCWWNIKSQSANEIIWAWTDTSGNVPVIFESTDVDNGTDASGSFNFFVEKNKRILSRSSNLRFTVKPVERSGDDIEFNYYAIAAGCGGEIVAVDNQRYFVTPINRRDFLNKTSCEWNISTKSKNEVVVLSLSVAEIEEQNYLAARTSSANIPNGRNLTTIMIQKVNKETPISISTPHDFVPYRIGTTYRANHIRIRFQPDENNIRRVFKANFHSGDANFGNEFQ